MKLKRILKISFLLVLAIVSTYMTASAMFDVEKIENIDDIDDKSSSVDSKLTSRFILQDNVWGGTYNLDLFGPIIIGYNDYGETCIGIIIGDEMGFWCIHFENGYTYAYTGIWDYGTIVFDGYYVADPSEDTGPIQLSIADIETATSESEIDRRIVDATSAKDGQIRSAIGPDGDLPDNSEGTSTEVDCRGAICLEDEYGYIWDLDIMSGFLLYGTKTSSIGTYPAYGFLAGEPMMLWADNPGTPSTDSFVYTGNWDFGTMEYNGHWVGYPGGGSGTVELWFCGSQPTTEYYAVIVGEGYTCAWSDNDAYAMYNTLTSYPNWNPANIELLVSTGSGSIHDATRTNIENAINTIATEADSDDVVVFYYSGHGGYTNDVYPYDESDGYDEYICPEGGNIRDDELDTWLSAINGEVLVTLDTCFSGGFINKAESSDLVSRLKPGLERRIGGTSDGFARDLDKSGFNVLTACSQDESAYGIGAFQMGLYTYYLVQGLNGPADSDFDGDIDAQESYDYATPLAIAYMCPPNPQYYQGTANPLIWVE